MSALEEQHREKVKYIPIGGDWGQIYVSRASRWTMTMADDKTVCCPHVSRSTHDSMGVDLFFFKKISSLRLAHQDCQMQLPSRRVVWVGVGVG